MADGTSPVLEIRDLVIEYETREGTIRSLDSASLRVDRGEIVAVVGESGSGKSTLGLAVGRLLPQNATYVEGDVVLAGTSIANCDSDTLRRVRREDLGFIFQDPVAALDPTMRIGRQMTLAGGKDRQALADALVEVGLFDTSRVMRSYPHELSGGMAQRVGIAMTMLRQPRVVIADEPTAAVDAAGRAKILELLVTRCRERDCTLVVLTHDLGSVRRWCTKVAVMYGGRVVEDGPAEEVLAEPLHPYTRALAHSRPGREMPGGRLSSIPGVPPVLTGPSHGCAFASRCPLVESRCHTSRPVHASVGVRNVCCHVATGPAGDVEVGETNVARQGA